MKQISVDTASPAVKKFIRKLAKDVDGVEVTLDGNVICRVVPPAQLSEGEKAAQLLEVRRLLEAARKNSKRVPAPVIERKIRQAITTVRQGQ